MSRPRRRLPSRTLGPLTGDSRFSKGDTVEIVYSGQTGTSLRIEGPNPLTVLTYVHVRIEVRPWPSAP